MQTSILTHLHYMKRKYLHQLLQTIIPNKLNHTTNSNRISFSKFKKTIKSFKAHQHTILTSLHRRKKPVELRDNTFLNLEIIIGNSSRMYHSAISSNDREWAKKVTTNTTISTEPSMMHFVWSTRPSHTSLKMALCNRKWNKTKNAYYYQTH